ncbi:hypothetical protein [Undibacterium luofuense]|uniref:hypothetical protein n=1 Tax=Undibacterium luofuense TaxID=2828733 RepID=UPI0030EC300B
MLKLSRRLLLCLLMLVLPLQSLFALAHASCLPVSASDVAVIPAAPEMTGMAAHHCDEMQTTNATDHTVKTKLSPVKAHAKTGGCHQLSPCCTALAFLNPPSLTLPQPASGVAVFLTAELPRSVTPSVPVPPPRQS